MGWACRTHIGKRTEWSVFGGKPEGKGPKIGGKILLKLRLQK
jgi:hypothetical protein